MKTFIVIYAVVTFLYTMYSGMIKHESHDDIELHLLISIVIMLGAIAIEI